MKKFLCIVLTSLFLVILTSCNNPENERTMPETDRQQTSQADNSDKNSIDVQETIKGNSTIEDDKKELPEQDDTKSPENSSNITPENIPSNLDSSKIIYWMPGTNKEHKVPVMSTKYKNLLNKYNGYFTGDTSSKVIYLTFDEGYEYGLTPKILDILKINDVKAAFFMTKPYIKSNPDLVKRMASEGHICANHTNTHPSLPDLSDDKITKELTSTADYYKEVTGKEMDKFMRPPQGEWSERMLYVANSLGYKTILWSMAHKDWDVNNQPGKDVAYKFVDTHYHNGAILLLHPQSKSNTDALDDIIKNLKSKGYRFASLNELK